MALAEGADDVETALAAGFPAPVGVAAGVLEGIEDDDDGTSTAEKTTEALEKKGC